MKEEQEEEEGEKKGEREEEDLCANTVNDDNETEGDDSMIGNCLWCRSRLRLMMRCP